MKQEFNVTGERFADIQMLRYKLPGFDTLSLSQKLYIYYLSEAALWGRDIIFDQNGKRNLTIRRMLEYIYKYGKETLAADEDYQLMVQYLKRVWFSRGIHHHYGCEKFIPEFSRSAFEKVVADSGALHSLGISDEEYQDILTLMFDPAVSAKRVNLQDGVDVVQTSSCNYYDGVSQKEAEDFYAAMQKEGDSEPPSYGLNSLLTKQNDGSLKEDVYKIGGRYSAEIEHIVANLEKAGEYAENGQQKKIIALLVDYYRTGDLQTFDKYSIEWLKELDGRVDFINGFIEVYGDPLGLKGAWEGLVEYKDLEACKRTQLICTNAQWFEDHSPVESRFKKKVVKGVSANVICAAMLGGDEYPSTAIGINLPNADWIRAAYGSKSVTISNITAAYNEASKSNGFLDEYVCDDDVKALVRKYGDVCDDLHTDLHECLGHGSGQILPGVDANALKNYSSTIEEARADLFGLYYIADTKLVELGLVPDAEAYKSQYYTYILNGLLTQCVRIKEGDDIEESHMRNRAIIARWCYEHAEGAMKLERKTNTNGEICTYLVINDYAKLRQLFAQLLAEVQRMKSEGDFEAARQLVENYGVKLDKDLHHEILTRYRKLNLAPYKGFLNPRLSLVKNESGMIVDVTADFSESYDEQMMRYSMDYSTLRGVL